MKGALVNICTKNFRSIVYFVNICQNSLAIKYGLIFSCVYSVPFVIFKTLKYIAYKSLKRGPETVFTCAVKPLLLFIV